MDKLDIIRNRDKYFLESVLESFITILTDSNTNYYDFVESNPEVVNDFNHLVKSYGVVLYGDYRCVFWKDPEVGNVVGDDIFYN